MLQQQFMQGCALAQQGTMLEMSGNVMGAAQCFEQAAGIISNCIGAAQQYQMPVDANAWFNLSWCHFNAARTQTMIGWGVPPAHLMQAQNALNAAISLNPSFGPYHSAMGVLLATQGQPFIAIQAFTRAVQLNPADAFSHYMLGVLNQAQGNVAAGNQYLATARQYAPALPSLQQTLQPHAGGDKGFDWNGVVSTAGKFFEAVNTVANAFGNSGVPSGGSADWGSG